MTELEYNDAATDTDIVLLIVIEVSLWVKWPCTLHNLNAMVCSIDLFIFILNFLSTFEIEYQICDFSPCISQTPNI